MPTDPSSSRAKLAKRVLVIALLVATGLMFAALIAPRLVRSTLWSWEQNPILRGRQLAVSQGCLDCHRPWANTEIPNPRSRWGSVPRFGAGNAMMYVEGLDELEETIRYGAPLAWLSDPDIAERLASQPIRMPAYGDRLDDAAIADLVVWTALMEGIDAPGGEEARAGRAVALKFGCLACHGEEGAGGLPNPGSLGGFIPGFLGRNFDDLVADEAEFRQWVRTGTLERLGSKAWVRHFWDRQAIAMPAYEDRLTDEELSQLWTWIQAVRQDLADR